MFDLNEVKDIDVFLSDLLDRKVIETEYTLAHFVYRHPSVNMVSLVGSVFFQFTIRHNCVAVSPSLYGVIHTFMEVNLPIIKKLIRDKVELPTIKLKLFKTTTYEVVNVMSKKTGQSFSCLYNREIENEIN